MYYISTIPFDSAHAASLKLSDEMRQVLWRRYHIFRTVQSYCLWDKLN